MSAPILDSNVDALTPEKMITQDIHDPASKAEEIDQFLAATNAHGDAQDHSHTSGVASFALTYETPLDWTAFGIWMTMLLNHHGDKVLRIKGMLNVAGIQAPVLINGVQHVVHPPVHLESWPDDDRRSKLVFIVRGLEQAAIENSLAAFNGLANK
jgi:G3E family GTPase